MIDWSKAPEWARWCAMDASGSWWWHSKKPAIIGLEWGHPIQSEHWTQVERAPFAFKAPLWRFSLTGRTQAQKDSK